MCIEIFNLYFIHESIQPWQLKQTEGVLYLVSILTSNPNSNENSSCHAHCTLAQWHMPIQAQWWKGHRRVSSMSATTESYSGDTAESVTVLDLTPVESDSAVNIIPRSMTPQSAINIIPRSRTSRLTLYQGV